MKIRVTYEINFNEAEIRRVFIPECAEEYIRVLEGGPSNDGDPDTKDMIVNDLARQQILGDRNHGSDLGTYTMKVEIVPSRE